MTSVTGEHFLKVAVRKSEFACEISLLLMMGQDKNAGLLCLPLGFHGILKGAMTSYQARACKCWNPDVLSRCSYWSKFLVVAFDCVIHEHTCFSDFLRLIPELKGFQVAGFFFWPHCCHGNGFCCLFGVVKENEASLTVTQGLKPCLSAFSSWKSGMWCPIVLKLLIDELGISALPI